MKGADYFMGKYDTEKAGGKQAVTAIKTLVFSGYSDDTFGEWTTGVDYDNCGRSLRNRAVQPSPQRLLGNLGLPAS